MKQQEETQTSLEFSLQKPLDFVLEIANSLPPTQKKEVFRRLQIGVDNSENVI